MTTTLNLICFECKHFNEDGIGCKAFPEGIPDEILQSNEHAKPLADQKNEIVFEPIKNKK